MATEAKEKFECETSSSEDKTSLEFEWKVHKTVVNEIRREAKGCRESAYFNSKFYNTSWVMNLYHTNENQASNVNTSQYNLALSLDLKNSRVDLDKVWVKASLTVKHPNPQNNFTSRIHNVWSTGKTCNQLCATVGYNYINDNSYYHNDFMILCLTVEVKVIGRESILTSIPLEPPKPKNSLADKFAKLLKTGAYSDITLRVGNQKFKVHRGILSTNCDYFHAMFKEGFKESTDKDVEIKDIDPEIFKVILKFIYTNQLPEDLGSIVQDLLAAADRFGLQPVVEKCKEKLGETISLENCVEHLILADTFNQTDLKQKLISFIRYNIKTVVTSESWKELKKINYQLVIETLENSI